MSRSLGLLLEHGTKFNAKRPQPESVPSLAVETGREAIVQSLLDNSTNADACNKVFGTVLMWSVARGRRTISPLLCKLKFRGNA